MTVRETTDAIAERLMRELPAEAVWLFGSRARGDAGSDSDWDFLAVMPESRQTRYERAVAARRLVSDFRIPKDIVVLTRAEWEKDLLVPSSLANTVLAEGIPLHEVGMA